MGHADLRRNKQLEFLASGNDIEAGDASLLPISLPELLEVNECSPCVEKRIGSGLTADVFMLAAGGRRWNLKKKRAEILVKNADGQTSFLNEVQRRRDFEMLKKKNASAYGGVVDTAYASLKHGIIVSPWIEGAPVKKYTPEIISDLFNTLFHIETAGLFEYDLCPGNILVQKDRTVKLFDFGYMYPFSPLSEYNADGMELPLFHPVERFETRSFMQYLMDIEDEKDRAAALEEYRMEKELALEYYRRSLSWLRSNGADQAIINWKSDIVELWGKGLKNTAELENLYALESLRSYILDIHDDVGGRSCTAETLKKADRVISAFESGGAVLSSVPALSWGDENSGRAELIHKYRRLREKAVEYQISGR